MPQNIADKVLVVLLDDMVQHSLPRILAIREHIDQGQTLSRSEVSFFLDMLKRVTHCQAEYEFDAECRAIFSSIAHLLFEVIKKALENEQEHYVPLTRAIEITEQRLTISVES